jgi:hypothetical protein
VPAPLLRKIWIPTENDEADVLLRKIGLRGIFGGKALFPRVSVRDADAEKDALDLGRRSGGRRFVAPVIDVTILGDRNAPADLGTSITTEGTEDHPFQLWWTVSRAKRRGQVNIAYRQGDIGGAHEVDPSTVVRLQSNVPVAVLVG